MTNSEIQQILDANVDRTIEVKWANTSKQLVKVISVDVEGFVYDLVPPDPKTEYWTPFDEIEEITESKLS